MTQLTADQSPDWIEDLSALSLEEVLIWQAKNMAWSKELRTRSNALVNRRLAKDITLDDYASGRKQTHEETLECRRRTTLLNALINERMAQSSK